MITVKLGAPLQNGDTTVTIHPDDRDLYAGAVAGLGDPRLSPPVAGGVDRQASCLAGLAALAVDAPDLVLIHDAVRPFIRRDAIDRVIEARKKLDENTAFLDECRKNREDSKAKYMQVKALCGEFKAIYGQHCDTVRTMENVVRGSQSYLTNAIDSLTIVATGYPFYAALMDSLLDGLPAEKKEE